MDTKILPLLITDPATQALKNLPDWWKRAQEIVIGSYSDTFLEPGKLVNLGKKDPLCSSVGRYESWRMPDLHHLKHDEGCGLILLTIYSHPKIEHNELFALLKLYSTHKTVYEMMFSYDLTFLSSCKMIEETDFLEYLYSEDDSSSFRYSITQLGIDVLKQNGLVKVDK